MYLPRYHRLDDPRLARSLMRAQPLATWICVIDGDPVVSQDEAPADRVGTVAGLRARNTGSDRAMADLVEQHDRPARNAPRG